MMNQHEREIVSYHEVGHALISAVQKNSEPVQKITIVPRTMGALGYVMQVPEEEHYLNSKEELHDMIVGLLGGRAAEELKFHSVTTGASNDIEKATGLAKSMVTQYGMSDRFGLMGLATVESKYLDGRAALNCADATAAAVDEEVRSMMESCYQEAKEILSQNMDVMDTIAAYLIKEETITGEQFMKLYRKEKGIPEPENEAKTTEERFQQQLAKEEHREETFRASVDAAAQSEAKSAEEIPVSEEPVEENPASEEPVSSSTEEAVQNVTGTPEPQQHAEDNQEKPDTPRGRFSDVPMGE